MKRTKGDSNFEEKGKKGLASAVRLNEENFRLDFEDGNSVEIKISKETVPACFPVASYTANKPYQVKVTLNKDGNKVLFATPARGEFFVKFSKFFAKDGQPPVPETRIGKGEKPYKTFTANLEISQGKWKGVNLPAYLYPNFGKDEDGFLSVSGQGSGSDFLYDFLEATGVAKNNLPYEENPLPAIEKVAQSEATEFKVVVNKGNIDTIIVPFETDEEDDEVPEALKD